MTSNSRLEELKQQVRQTSNQQLHLQAQREQDEETVAYHKQAQDKNQQEMAQFVRNVFGQSELAAAKERELLHDQLERFAHSQNVMNEQMITLNDNLTDMTALKALYDAKRAELELDFKNQKEALERQIEQLSDNYASKKWRLDGLYQKQKEEYDKIIEAKKDEARQLDIKIRWINLRRIAKWTAIVAVVIFVIAFMVFLAMNAAGKFRFTTRVN